jgi:hypothetical protein
MSKILFLKALKDVLLFRNNNISYNVEKVHRKELK